MSPVELKELVDGAVDEARANEAGLAAHVRMLPSAEPASEVFYSSECPSYPFACKRCACRAMEAIMSLPSFVGALKDADCGDA